jgi:hypothetical protein
MIMMARWPEGYRLCCRRADSKERGPRGSGSGGSYADWSTVRLTEVAVVSSSIQVHHSALRLPTDGQQPDTVARPTLESLDVGACVAQHSPSA